ncbi:MAG TPA: hypothetical protein VF611_02280 [Pyrinomonadaceae bacterium]|jgi:methyl-accepting chemotaxis protein
MTEQQMEKAIAFILEQQAQLTATVGRVSGSVDVMAEKVDKLASKVDRTAGGITDLLAVAEIQAAGIRDLTESIRTLADRQRESEERGRRTDERLDALINIVERHIGEGRNGKA